MAIDPRQGYGTNPSAKPPPQRLSGAKQGFPLPGLAAARNQDQIPNTPPVMTTRQHAYNDAARLLQDNKGAILLAESVAMGTRRGYELCNKNTQDPNFYWSNPRSEPINILGKFVVTPVNPTAAQIAAANLLAAANFNPAEGVIPPLSDYPTYQFGIISGIGIGLQVPIRSDEVLILDSLGITTFSEAAEYELLWALLYGAVQAGSTAPTNQGTNLIPKRRGWLGTAERPVQLQGNARLAPQQGPNRTGDSQVVIAFEHDGNQASLTYTPWPHYVELALRGWRVIIGPEGEVQTTGIGGPSCSPEAGK